MVMDIRLHGTTELSAQIDEEDYELVSPYKWYLGSNGYATTTYHRKGRSRGDLDRNVNLSMHRLLMGVPPRPALFVDHIDRNRLNNCRNNLRWVTPQQSAANTAPISGYKGVRRDRSRWSAQIRSLHLGSFGSEEEAALVYDKAARHFFWEYAYLNFPDRIYPGDVRYIDFTPDDKKLHSDYTGVSYFGHGGKRVKRWRAVYRKKTLGYFHTELEAAAAYKEAKQKHESKQR